MSPKSSFSDRLNMRLQHWQSRQRLSYIAHQVERQTANLEGPKEPVVFFNASTRLGGLSQNAAFSLLTSWAVRLAGAPVIHMVCQAGMSHCILGTDRSQHTNPPPCAECIAQSRRLYAGAKVHWFQFQADPDLTNTLDHLSMDELREFETRLPSALIDSAFPVGRLVLPSIRWALRRHQLPDDEATRYLFRQYMLSAYRVACEFARLLTREKPSVAVIFNGIMYPEASARWVARQLGIRTVAHEVGFQPFSVFFTEGEPTAYPITIPVDFEMSPEQDARLDAYLEKRFQGQFSMAGIRFWPEMRRLDPELLEKMDRFQQTVAIFTNVIYDTSQVHANTLFPHMFAWLDAIMKMIQEHIETLFVIRAHPDEMRPGTQKQSKESVRDWVQDNQVDNLPNVVFIDSQEYLSSYELIQRAKFIIVYNSSIGLEASVMGLPVLCGGNARYTQYPTVFFPDSAESFIDQAHRMLAADQIETPPEHCQYARRFLYYQLYRVSLPLDEYLQQAPRKGYVMLKPFSWEKLKPENSSTLHVLVDGILNGSPFLMPEI